MLKKIKEVVKKTIKYVKKGVKWIMEKKNELINNSLVVRVYENAREDVKEVVRSASNGLRTVLSSETNTRKTAVIIAGSALGLAASLFASTYVR